MASEKLVQDMHRIVDDTISLPIDQLVSSPGKWGPINFEMARPEIQRSFAILGYLKILPIEILPESVLAAIRDHATNFLSAIISIRKFSIEEGGDPATRRNQMVEQIRAYSEHLFTAAQSYIPFLAYQRGDVEQNIRHLTDSVTQGKNIIVKAKEDAAQSKTDLDEIIRASREASATVGVGHFTQDFQTEADSLKNSAGSWLTATIILAIVTLMLAVALFFLDSYASIGHQISRVAILAALATATLWTGRIYKALLHQSSINRHRAHSLKTFQAFAQATPNQQTKDAVLLESTRAIFGPSPTGLIDPKAEQSDGPSTILEMVRSREKGAGD